MDSGSIYNIELAEVVNELDCMCMKEEIWGPGAERIMITEMEVLEGKHVWFGGAAKRNWKVN